MVLGVRNVTVRPVADATAATRATPAGARKARANNIAIPQEQQQQQRRRQRQRRRRHGGSRQNASGPEKIHWLSDEGGTREALASSPSRLTHLLTDANDPRTRGSHPSHASHANHQRGSNRHSPSQTANQRQRRRAPDSRGTFGSEVQRLGVWAPIQRPPKASSPLSQPPSTPASHSSLSACALSLHRTAHTRSLARLPASATGGAHSRSRALSPLLLLVRSPFRTLVACLLRSVGWSVAHSLARQATTRRGQRALFVPLCRLPPTLCSLLSLPQRGGSTVANGCSTTVSATQLQRTSSLSLSSPSLSARVCGCLLCNRWVGRLSAGVDTRLVCGREIYYVQPTRTKHHVGAMRCRMRTRPTVSLAPTVLVQRNRCFSRGCNIHTP